MKKNLFALVAVLFSVSLTAQAQYEYKPFRVDLGTGLSFAGIGGFGIGVLLAVEPKYSVNQVSFGTRFELNGLYQDINWDEGRYVAKVNASALLTTDYHFTTATFRPFVGGGLGAYSLAVSVEDDYYSGSYTDDYGTKLGVMLRVGFDVTHFRFALQYNFVGRASSVENNRLRGERNFSYFSLAVSGYVGGKKIRK